MKDPNEGKHDIPGVKYVRKGDPFIHNRQLCYNAEYLEFINGEWKSWGTFTIPAGLPDSVVAEELIESLQEG